MKACRMWMTAAGAGLAAMTCSAQWTNQLLNSFAVTNEFGQMIVLHDGGGAWSGGAMSADKAFDGNPNTYYDAARATNAWAGFGLQTPMAITKIRYTGRANNGGRVGGVLIQGANTSDFSDAETIWTLPAPPGNWDPPNTWLEATFASPAAVKSFSFVRFYCPLNSYGGNFSRVEFYGADPTLFTAPAAPVLAFDGCVNWRMNMLWTRDPVTVMLYEVQRRIAWEDGFSTVATFALPAAGTEVWRDASLLLYQDTEYRVRACNPGGNSAWVTVMGLARDGLTGTWIGTQGSYSTGTTGDKAFDGNVTSYFDGPNNGAGGNGFWTGLDFGSDKEIVGLRFVPRREFPDRTAGSRFEAADNPDFINPTVIYPIPSSPYPSVSGVTEIFFNPTVTTRYARYCSKDGAWGNIAEAEFVQAPSVPRPPQGLTAASPNIPYGDITLRWTLNNVGSLISSVMVYRATSPGGPFDLMTPEGVSGLEWTDTAVAASIVYYYRVTSLFNTAGAPLESVPSGHVSALSHMHLERDPGDLTQIRPGMNLLGTHYPIFGALSVGNMFDGSAATFPDINNSNPAIGVDLGKPCQIHFMRFMARQGQEGRLNGAELRGSNDPDYTNSFTRLATFTGAAAGQTNTQMTVTQEAFRYIFVQRPDGNQFYGNINELELYGFDPDAAPGLLQAPATVTPSIQPGGGIRLDWLDGSAQDSYRVQRSADGVGNWTDLGDTQASPFTDANPIMGQRMFYRVVAVRGQEVAYSAAYPIVAYAPGNGTGLTASYFANFTPGYNPAEAFAGAFLEPAPNFQPADSAPIRPDVLGSVSNVRIAWTGNLAIPFTAAYTFYVTCDDGFALWVDGESVLNRWYGNNSVTAEVTLPLTAGPHALRLDYYQGSGGKKMKLEWGGAVERCVIPTAQLTPLPLPEVQDVFLGIGPWQGRTFNAPRLGYHAPNPDGSITVASAGGDLSGTGEQHHFVWQRLALREFAFEAKVNMALDIPNFGSGKGFLMVRNDLAIGTPFLAFSTIANAAGRFNVKQRIPPNASVTDALSWSGPMLNPAYMKVMRKNGIFTFAYRADTLSPWTTFHTWADTGELFGKSLYIGFGVCAPGSPAGAMFQKVTFSEISIQPLSAGTVLIIK